MEAISDSFYWTGRAVEVESHSIRAFGARSRLIGTGRGYWTRSNGDLLRPSFDNQPRQGAIKDGKGQGFEDTLGHTDCNVRHVSCNGWEVALVKALDGHETLKRDYCQVLETEVNTFSVL